MNLKKALEPKDVEEVKPNLFIQKKGNSYRQVKPLVWNNQWRFRGQIRWLNIVIILIIVALYFTGAKYVRFYQDVNSDPKSFCQNVSIIDWEDFEVNNENTNTIQFDRAEAPTTYESG